MAKLQDKEFEQVSGGHLTKKELIRNIGCYISTLTQLNEMKLKLQQSLEMICSVDSSCRSEDFQCKLEETIMGAYDALKKTDENIEAAESILLGYTNMLKNLL